jgi:Tfp pilus assembly protein PilZ
VETDEKILVIDPDARACRALRDAVEAAGFATAGAHSEPRGRALLTADPRPVALVVGASDPSWRDGLVQDFRAAEPQLVIVALLAPGDEYEALLELGASACTSAATAEAHLGPLLSRLVQARRTRARSTPPANPDRASTSPSVASAPARTASPARRPRLDELLRGPIGAAAPASARASDGPIEVRMRTWADYAALAPQLKRGALFVETNAPRQVADGVRVRLVVPDGSTLELAAEVKNVLSIERAASTGKPAGMGVRFVDLSDEQQHALARFEEASRRPAEPAPPVPEPVSARAATEPAGVPGAAFSRGASPTEPSPAPPPRRFGSPIVDERTTAVPPSAERFGGAALAGDHASSAPMSGPVERGASSLGGRTKADMLREHFAVLQRADAFGALGVSPDASPEDIRLAFVGLAKKWHPNKFAVDGPEVRGLATEIFIALKKARDTLSDPKKLAAHRARFEASAGATSGAQHRADDGARLGTPRPDGEPRKARGQ